VAEAAFLGHWPRGVGITLFSYTSVKLPRTVISADIKESSHSFNTVDREIIETLLFLVQSEFFVN